MRHIACRQTPIAIALLQWTPPVLCPQRLEVDCQADLAASVHLGCLPFQLRQLNLRRDCWVGGRHLKLKVKLILDVVVHVPALAGPLFAAVAGLYGEPVCVALLVHLDVLNERLQLLQNAAAQKHTCDPVNNPLAPAWYAASADIFVD